MLFKSTVKAASAAALWMVALLGANSAMAIDLDSPVGAGNAPVTFAAEDLAANPQGVYAVEHASLLVATAKLGTLAGVVNKTEQVFVRVDLEGVLRVRGTTAPSLGVADGTNSSLARAASTGNNNTNLPRDQHLIYTVGAEENAESNDVMTLDFAGTAGVTGIGTGTVRVRIYDEIRDAVGGASNAMLDKRGPVLAVSRSVKVTPLRRESTATVDTGFKQFEAYAGAGYEQNIASLTISTTCLRGAADGEYLDGPNATPCVISADPTTATTPSLDAVNVNTTGAAEGGSTVVVTGEGGFAFASRVAFYDGEGTGAAFDACGGTARTASFPQVDGKPDKAGPVTGDVGTMATTMGNYHLCATMAAANAERIELGAYTADVNLVAAEGGRPFLPLSASDLSVGTIKHDGTTVRIPFLSSFENYTQRLVIVNRNKADVGYTLRFHMEGSMGTVDPMEVEGVAMAGVTTVVKVADVVTFTNPTRGSGTLEIVSNPRMVDVATTMINKMDQSSDTVILHLGKRDLNNIGP